MCDTINSFRKHTMYNDIVWHSIIAIGKHTLSNEIGSGLDGTHGRMKLSLSRHHIPWITYTIGRHRTWHVIITLGLRTQIDDVGRGMPSSLLESTHGRTISGFACYQPLDSTHSLTTSGVACHHTSWIAPTVGRQYLCNVIIFVGQ